MIENLYLRMKKVNYEKKNVLVIRNVLQRFCFFKFNVYFKKIIKMVWKIGVILNCYVLVILLLYLMVRLFMF